MKFTTRAYNTFQLNTNTKASIVKKSKEARLLGEIEYYKNLPKELQVFFPRMLSYEESGPYEMELEYYAYDNLGNMMINYAHDDSFWERAYDFIFSYIEAYKLSTAIDSSCRDAELMFIDKTEKEYIALVEKFEFFQKLKDEDEIIFNGKSLKNFTHIWAKVKSHINKSFCDRKAYYIHGDLCFSNILCGVNPITNDVILKFIDPRGEFGKTKFYGDMYYDFAKLLHSTNGGYEYFIYDKFNLSNSNNNEFTLEYINGDKRDNINSIFKRRLEENNINYSKVKTIEGLIFIGMCARHYDSLERQKAMYLTGLSILNDVYEKL